MKHLKDLLNSRIKQSGFAQPVQNSLIIEEFNKIIIAQLGKNIIAKIKPLYIKNKALTLVCLNSIIIQEITMQKEILLSQINKRFGSKVVTDIKFII